METGAASGSLLKKRSHGVAPEMTQEQTRSNGALGAIRVERQARAVWAGSLFEGSGSVCAASRAFADLPITWASRADSADGRTSPEELLAAAHAACFSMAFSLVLAEAGTAPEELTVDATCVFGQVSDGFAITTVELDVVGRVPGVGAHEFEQAAQRAAALCPVSKALTGNVAVTLTARLGP
jgi:osmotically inducible protein OsmC